MSDTPNDKPADNAAAIRPPDETPHCKKCGRELKWEPIRAGKVVQWMPSDCPSPRCDGSY